MGYVITAFYSTGDSYNNYDTSTELAPVWNELSEAKEALRWLNEHHLYCEAEAEDHAHRPWNNIKDVSDLKSKPWYKQTEGETWAQEWYHSAKLPMSNGKLQAVDVPYHGYFEHLTKLEISAQIDGELSYEYH